MSFDNKGGWYDSVSRRGTGNASVLGGKVTWNKSVNKRCLKVVRVDVSMCLVYLYVG